MKKRLAIIATVALILNGVLITEKCNGQNLKKSVKRYFTVFSSGKPENNGKLNKYLMKATYVNRNLDGNFTGKTFVSGEYMRGFKDGHVEWENVYLASSDNVSEPFPRGTKQEFMENFRYIPSEKMLTSEAFKDFPATPENVFIRNLIWDMYTFEKYAWDFSDSLSLNTPFILSEMGFQFDMAEIGKYTHNKILLSWNGISLINGEICSVIEFDAIDNILEITMPGIRTKGAEQYWGTIWVSLVTHEIEQAVMYSGTVQQIEVESLKDKFFIKTVREIKVEKIH